MRLRRDAKNTGLSVLHTLYLFELPAFSSHEQFPLTKFWCKLLTSCQVMLPTSHFCMIFPTVMNLPSVGVFSCKRIAAQFLTFVPSFLNPLVRTNSLYENRTVVFFFLSPHTPSGRVRHAREALTLLSFYSKPIGPLQLAIHVVQNRHAGEQKSHWDMANKRHTWF